MIKFKFIPGTNNLYKASSCGIIKRVERYVTNNKDGGKRLLKEQELSQKTKSNGYKEVNLYIEANVSKMFYVHRAVASAFIREIPAGMAINHIDGNKANNNVSNLEIVSYSDNSRHAIRTGLRLYKTPVFQGSKHKLSKLTEDQVIEIRKLHSENKSLLGLDTKFNVSKGSIAKICYRATWRHI